MGVKRQNLLYWHQISCIAYIVYVQNELINTTTVVQYNEFNTAEFCCFLLSLILLLVAFKSWCAEIVFTQFILCFYCDQVKLIHFSCSRSKTCDCYCGWDCLQGVLPLQGMCRDGTMVAAVCIAHRLGQHVRKVVENCRHKRQQPSALEFCRYIWKLLPHLCWQCATDHKPEISLLLISAFFQVFKMLFFWGTRKVKATRNTKLLRAVRLSYVWTKK